MEGILILNKPKGFTSQDVVSKVKKILNVKKAGHTGTLDPLATGVLPILIGNYTKLSKYLIEHDKAYIAKIKFGEKRSTGDLEGDVVETSEVRVKDETKIIEVLQSMLGKQMQTPPMYSAIKVNGKKLYEYARAGENVEIPPREIEIYQLDFISFNETEQILEIRVRCSKGTYIRTLCEDIATKLETVGFMTDLQRVQVDQFTIEEAITLEELDSQKEHVEEYLIKMEKVFQELPKINLPANQKDLLLNGVKLNGYGAFKNGTYNIYINESFVGLGIIKDGVLKRDIIL